MVTKDIDRYLKIMFRNYSADWGDDISDVSRVYLGVPLTPQGPSQAGFFPGGFAGGL